MTKKVLILGASSEIGIQTVNMYLKNDWSVIAHFSKNNKELKKIKSKKLSFFKYDLKKIEKDIKNNKILKYYKTDNQFEYSLFNAKKFKEYTLLKLQKDHFYFLDKKTKFIMKKFLKNKSRVEIKDFERNV